MTSTRIGREGHLSSSNVSPRRGEIWTVNLDPTVGAEMQKTRPAVVISSDAVGKLPIKWVAPMTDWKDRYATQLWFVRIEPDARNGLSKVSGVDARE